MNCETCRCKQSEDGGCTLRCSMDLWCVRAPSEIKPLFHIQITGKGDASSSRQGSICEAPQRNKFWGSLEAAHWDQGWARHRSSRLPLNDESTMKILWRTDKWTATHQSFPILFYTHVFWGLTIYYTCHATEGPFAAQSSEVVSSLQTINHFFLRNSHEV